jgi:hypothetical protein
MRDIFQILLSVNVLFIYTVNFLYHTVLMTDDRMNEQARNIGVMEMKTKKPKHQDKILSECHIVHHKSHNGCDKRQGLRRKRRATNHIGRSRVRSVLKINS